MVFCICNFEYQIKNNKIKFIKKQKLRFGHKGVPAAAVKPRKAESL
jgi:hypothetical protein